MNSANRILVVDDDMMNRELLQSMLMILRLDSEGACDGNEALEMLPRGFGVVLMDINMPGMNGFEVVRKIREHPDYHDLPIIMVTALSSKEDRLRAVEAGANDFITKPIDKTELRIRVTSMLKMKAAQDTVKQYQLELEDKVRARTSELRAAIAEIEIAHQETYHAHMNTITRLAHAAEFRDEQTADHIQRVGNYCALIARKLGLPEKEVEIIYRASPMHDVGKLGIPDAVLLKKGPLTEEEWTVMKQHTLIGARILSNSSSPVLQVGEIIALTHHEKWDGSGYPHGLKETEIPLYGRICAVADVYDALTSERPYKPIIADAKALEIMQEARGKHFDPALLDIFMENMVEVLDIRSRFRDASAARIFEGF